ncbi:MAG: hypothetical protein M1816_008280 [Peltula sp. TS41687]|nr:MAG: hypothetical protein M1816_008280 [Peltula sp. TS41687]
MEEGTEIVKEESQTRPDVVPGIMDTIPLQKPRFPPREPESDSSQSTEVITSSRKNLPDLTAEGGWAEDAEEEDLEDVPNQSVKQSTKKLAARKTTATHGDEHGDDDGQEHGQDHHRQGNFHILSRCQDWRMRSIYKAVWICYALSNLGVICTWDQEVVQRWMRKRDDTEEFDHRWAATSDRFLTPIAANCALLAFIVAGMSTGMSTAKTTTGKGKQPSGGSKPATPRKPSVDLQSCRRFSGSRRRFPSRPARSLTLATTATSVDNPTPLDRDGVHKCVAALAELLGLRGLVAFRDNLTKWRAAGGG